MFQIKKIKSLEILDSRGNPTIEAEVTLEKGAKGRAAVPSGASTGSREALEWRDKDFSRYFGKGVKLAVNKINNEIASAFHAFKFNEQKELDDKLLLLDGTPNKENLGANTLLAISLATAKACAAQNEMPLYQFLNKEKQFRLPIPMMNIINGGVHADNNLDIQEFMILPVAAPSFEEALRYGVEIFHQLKNVLHKRKLITSVGDEGGFAPSLKSNEEALEIILQAIEEAGYMAGKEIYLGIDVASNELYRNGKYQLENKNFSANELTDYFAQLVSRYPIISIEDGMGENDWEGWKILTERLGKKIQLVGDDLFVTNTKLLQKGITERIANAILIKPNQIGTLSETLEAIQMAKKAGYNTIISHRSGETEDTTIADIAVGANAGQIKTGSLCRSDRVAKYNRLLRIANELGSKETYAGKEVFSQFNSFFTKEMMH